MLLTILSLATTALALPHVKRQTFSNSSCTTTGVHMIVARASTEYVGVGGLLAPIVAAIEEHLPGSDHVAVDYPASLIDFGNSVNAGVTTMTSLIETYVASCPDSKIALIGYSQGAQVVGDTLCGTTSVDFTHTSALSSAYKDNIVAAIMFGDPANDAGLPINMGTSTNNGAFPRQNADDCQEYVPIMRSWCDDGDLYCDNGVYLEPHFQYIGLYGVTAATFICSQANAAGLPACS